MTLNNTIQGGLSDTQLDVLTINTIPAEKRREEPQLYATKWWDYKWLHPMDATIRLSLAYEQAHRETWIKRGETVVANKLPRHANPYAVSTEKMRLGFWQARRAADTLGIPYLFFCRAALDASEEMDWKEIARPNELTNSALQVRVLEKWLEYQEAAIPRPENSLYLAVNYKGHPYQDEFQAWLCKKIRARKRWELALESYLTTAPFLTVEHARAEFGDVVLHRILRKDQSSVNK